MANGYVGVPTSYTPVEYIESSGTQYIDTGLPQDGFHTIIDVAFTNFTNTHLITGTYGPSDNQRYYLRINTNGSVVTQFGGYSGNNLITGPTIVVNTRYMLEAKLFNGEQFLKVDNVSYGSKTISGQTYPSGNVYLFGIWDSGNAGGLTSCKLYSAKYYNSSDTLVRDFIPAIDDNNVACLYDLVEGKFYYNTRSGTFGAGSTTGQPVSIGDKARKLRKGYVGINDVARKIIRGYVGVNGVAKLCFGSFIPRYSTTITNTIHKIVPAVANTTDYIIIAGGSTTDGVNPVKTVTAYSSSLVSTQAADMPIQTRFQGACGFNGYAIIAGGTTSTSGSSRTNQMLAYNNNLTVSSLPTITTSVYESTATSNNVHFIVEGGSYYTNHSNYATMYDTNFTKSSLSNMSLARRNHSAAAVGNYIVCCGGNTTYGNVDFYDNTNVKTTSSDPYGKVCYNNLGLSTNNHAIFFGGATSQNMANAYKDCKAYDKNKVLSSFNLPKVAYGAQGFSTGDYAFVGYTYDSYVYDDNLVLVEHITHDANIYGTSVGTQGAATDSFAIIHHDWSTSIRVLTI